MSISRDSLGPRAAACTNRNVSAYRLMSVTRSRYKALDAFSTYTAPGSGAGKSRLTNEPVGSPAAPALSPRAALATSGQGLMLVTALAARWGHHGNQHGRTVWFEITCP
jgi:hypothetical protein